jgi:NADPH:quinone reductase-like Zn-dependent oxidoreductase
MWDRGKPSGIAAQAFRIGLDMKAVLLNAYGGPDQLEFRTDVPQPVPQTGEVLVRVRATSINPVDWKIRSGAAQARFPQQLPTILGRDAAGEVAALGPGVTGFTIGQRVMALTLHTYAEYCVVKANDLAAIPDNLDFEHAAALPLVVITGSQLVERAANIERGQTILITGALGGVGRTAVYAALQRGARVTVGVRESRREAAKALNPENIVALDDKKQLELLKDFDAIADTVGGPVAQQLLHAVKPGGVFASVLGPPEGAEKFDLRVAAMMSQPDAKRLTELALAVANGAFEIPIAKVMPLSEIREAQELEEKGHPGGKIVLTV